MAQSKPTAPHQHPDEGFSLVEVLTVLAILGVLAGIAFLILNRQQDKAVAASVKSDLHNYAILESAYGTEKGQFGDRAEVDEWAEHVNLSPGNTLQVIEATTTGFCLRATDRTTTLTWFYDSARGGLLPEGEYCGALEPGAPGTASPTDPADSGDGCQGSGHGGPGNNYCPGSNANAGNHGSPRNPADTNSP